MSRELRLDRSYAAPPERVFAAWRDVALLTQWWGCAPDMLWSVQSWEMHEGGKIHTTLDVDGKPLEVHGEFLVVDPPRRLQYTFGDDVVDVRIEPKGQGSHLFLTHSGQPSDEQLEVVRAGWTHALTLLSDRLASPSTV